MAQTDKRYFATYCRLDLQSDDLEAFVNGDAVGIGMEQQFQVEHYQNERGKEFVRGIVKDAKGEPVGFLPADCARRICDLSDEGWTVRVAPSAVGFTEDIKRYWAEVAVICYEPHYASSFEPFFDGICERLAIQHRPDIRLSDKLISAALDGEKIHDNLRTTTYPKLFKGEAYYKTQRTVGEAMIKGSQNNSIGCWLGTALFWAVIIGGIGFIVYKLFLS